IPMDDIPGTIYTVEFEFQSDYIEKLPTSATASYVDSSSTALQKLDREKQSQPDGTKLIKVEDTITDSTITFQMDGSEGLVYGFCYSEGT
ncbi:hypothetical protein LI169_18315, partial [Desulfovibrio desulfuricans]|nr:hypothetical protein [Desulfovibrio desulfuricans]